MFPRWGDWVATHTAKGLRKRRTRNLLRWCTALGVIVAVTSLRRNKISLGAVKETLKGNVRQTLVAAQDYLSQGIQFLLQRL
jgi:hypothetical protein